MFAFIRVTVVIVSLHSKENLNKTLGYELYMYESVDLGLLGRPARGVSSC